MGFCDPHNQMLCLIFGTVSPMATKSKRIFRAVMEALCCLAREHLFSSKPATIIPCHHQAHKNVQSQHGIGVKQLQRPRRKYLIHQKNSKTILLANTGRNLGEYVWEWILRMLYQGGENVTLHWAQLIKLSPFTRNCTFNVSPCSWKGFLQRTWLVDLNLNLPVV